MPDRASIGPIDTIGLEGPMTIARRRLIAPITSLVADGVSSALEAHVLHRPLAAARG